MVVEAEDKVFKDLITSNQKIEFVVQYRDTILNNNDTIDYIEYMFNYEICNEELIHYCKLLSCIRVTSTEFKKSEVIDLTYEIYVKYIGRKDMDLLRLLKEIGKEDDYEIWHRLAARAYADAHMVLYTKLLI